MGPRAQAASAAGRMRARTARREGRRRSSRETKGTSERPCVAAGAGAGVVVSRPAPPRPPFGRGEAPAGRHRRGVGCVDARLCRGKTTYFRASARSGGGTPASVPTMGVARRHAERRTRSDASAGTPGADSPRAPSPPAAAPRRSTGAEASFAPGRAGPETGRPVGLSCGETGNPPTGDASGLEIGPRLGHRERAGDVAERLKALVC